MNGAAEALLFHQLRGRGGGRAGHWGSGVWAERETFLLSSPLGVSCVWLPGGAPARRIWVAGRVCGAKALKRRGSQGGKGALGQRRHLVQPAPGFSATNVPLLQILTPANRLGTGGILPVSAAGPHLPDPRGSCPTFRPAGASLPTLGKLGFGPMAAMSNSVPGLIQGHHGSKTRVVATVESSSIKGHFIYGKNLLMCRFGKSRSCSECPHAMSAARIPVGQSKQSCSPDFSTTSGNHGPS